MVMSPSDNHTSNFENNYNLKATFRISSDLVEYNIIIGNDLVTIISNIYQVIDGRVKRCPN